MSAKGEGSTGRSPGVTLGGGRRGYQVARPRSNTWLWILNAVVIGFVVIAAFLASTGIGHTVAGASYHFMLYYMGVLALIALTAEVGIGLVCTDRIFMRPAGRVTMQAIHRATGFGAIAFLISHIILEIMASRSTVLDSVIPFLYPSGNKSFYLGLGTLASDMFILIMVIGVYRARLATRMSPTAWRVLHASAYVAWIFGLVHGLLAGRPAKAFFGYEGFVYWSYGFCVVAVALALVVRFVAKDRARNELSDQVVAEPPPGASLSSAAALTSMGMGGGMTATALAGAPHAAGALEGGRPGAAARGGRAQLALPAGKGSGSGRTGQFQATGRLGETRWAAGMGQSGMGQTAMGQTARFGRPGAFDQFGADHPSGPLPQVDQFGQFGADHPSGPLPQIGRPMRNQPQVPSGQRDWHAAYERPMGVRRPDAPAPRYEQTGEIDRSGQFDRRRRRATTARRTWAGPARIRSWTGRGSSTRRRRRATTARRTWAGPARIRSWTGRGSSSRRRRRATTGPADMGRSGSYPQLDRSGQFEPAARRRATTARRTWAGPARTRSWTGRGSSSRRRRRAMTARRTWAGPARIRSWTGPASTSSRGRPSTTSAARRRAMSARPSMTSLARTGRRVTRPAGPARPSGPTTGSRPPRTTAQGRTPGRTSTGRRPVTTSPGRTQTRSSPGRTQPPATTSLRWGMTWPPPPQPSLPRAAGPAPGRSAVPLRRVPAAARARLWAVRAVPAADGVRPARPVHPAGRLRPGRPVRAGASRAPRVVRRAGRVLHPAAATRRPGALQPTG